MKLYATDLQSAAFDHSAIFFRILFLLKHMVIAFILSSAAALYNKNIWYTSTNWIIITITLWGFINNTSLYVFKESNISYNENIEILYNISNYAINSNNLPLLLLLTSLILVIKRRAELSYNYLLGSSYFVESSFFCTSYTFNIYYVLSNNNNFSLHDNINATIHPLITNISFFIYIYWISIADNNIEKSRATVYTYYLISNSLLLGGVWALSTEGWGGIWAWDPTEIVLLLLFINLLVDIHNKRLPKWIKRIVILFSFFYLQTNKFNLVSGIHNFYISSVGFSFYFLTYIALTVFFIVLSILLSKHFNYLKKVKGLVFFSLVMITFIIKNNEVQIGMFLLDLIFWKYIIVTILISNVLSYLTYSKAYYRELTYFSFIAICSLLFIHKEFFVCALTLLLYFYTKNFFFLKKKSKWTYKSHLKHFVVLGLLLVNFVYYSTFEFLLENIVMKNLIFERIHNFNYIEFFFQQYEKKEMIFFNSNSVGINHKLTQESSESIKLQYQTFNFNTNFFNLIMSKGNEIAGIKEEICLDYLSRPNINLYNNGVILMSYWIVITWYIMYIKW